MEAGELPRQRHRRHAQSRPRWVARVVVNERDVAPRVRRVQAVDLGERDGLDHRESLRRAIAQVVLRLLQGAAMKKLPRRVAEIEERGAIIVHQKTADSG